MIRLKKFQNRHLRASSGPTLNHTGWLLYYYTDYGKIDKQQSSQNVSYSDTLLSEFESLKVLVGLIFDRTEPRAGSYYVILG